MRRPRNLGTLGWPEIPSPRRIKARTDVPRSSGVYFVWSGGEVVYVGRASDLSARVLTHAKGWAAGLRFSWLEFEKPDAAFAECFYIGALRPTLNFAPKPKGEGA